MVLYYTYASVEALKTTGWHQTILVNEYVVQKTVQSHSDTEAGLTRSTLLSNMMPSGQTNKSRTNMGQVGRYHGFRIFKPL